MRRSKYRFETEQRIRGEIVKKEVVITRSGYIRDAKTSEEKSYNTYLRGYRERSKTVAMGPRLNFTAFLEYKRSVEIGQKRGIIGKVKSYASYIVKEQEEVSHKQANRLAGDFFRKVVRDQSDEGKAYREALKGDPLYDKLSKMNKREFYALLKKDPSIKDQLFSIGDVTNPTLYTKHKRKYRKTGQDEYYYTPNWLHDSP